MEKFEKALLYRGFNMHESGDSQIVIDNQVVKGVWVVGYLQPMAGLAFITPYNLKATYKPDACTLLSPAVPVVKETVSVATGLYDDFDLPKLIFQDDLVEYNDGVHIFKGRVVFACGAFGIGCDDNIPLDYSDSCRNDNFISFWELMSQQDVIENTVDYVTVIGNVWEGEK